MRSSRARHRGGTSPRIAAAAGALILLLSTGPAIAGEMEAGVRTVTLTRADDGAVVELHTGDRLVLQLRENPTTGYRWALEGPPSDVVALHDTHYSRSPGAAVGGGGQRTWIFTAAKPGRAPLVLKLWRSWEGDASISERFTATLVVQGK